MSTLIWGNETMDVSGELLGQKLDGDFTKGQHENIRARNPVIAMLKDPETNIIFYGIVKTPDWFKFDEDRMFCNPANARKLLKRRDVLTALGKKKVEVLKYYVVNKDSRYARLRDSLGAKFDVVNKAGMKVIGTVSSAAQLSKLRNRAHFACKNTSNATHKYRVYMGHPDVTPVLGATTSEQRTLTFKEAVLFESTEEARAHMENLFEEGILAENMGKGFKAWTEEKHLSGDDLEKDKHYKTFENISKAMNELYDLDYCAVDVVIMGGKVVVTNVTAFPSLQTDDVLDFVSAYFVKLTTEGRKITPEHIKRLVEGMNSEQLDVVAKLFKKALGAGG